MLFVSCHGSYEKRNFSIQIENLFLAETDTFGELVLGLPDPGSPSSQPQPGVFSYEKLLISKTFEKLHVIIAAGRRILRHQGDNKH